MAVPIYILTNSAHGSLFHTPLAALLSFFENSHSNRREMMLCVVLICISLSKVILNIFSCNYVNISFCFSQTSYGYTFSVHFAPSCGRFLGLCALLTLQCTGLSDGCAPLAFPRDVQTLKFVISPWPVDAGWLSVPQLSARARSLCRGEGVQGTSPGVEQVCGGEAHTVLEMPVGCGRGINGQSVLATHGQASWWSLSCS